MDKLLWTLDSSIISFLFPNFCCILFSLNAIVNKIKVRLPTFKKVGFICFIGGPLKMMKNAFYFISNAFLLSRYLDFCLNCLVHVGKWIDNKDKDNLEIYGVRDWERNNYGTHIAQYLKKRRQLDNEFLPVNRMQHEKCFYWKISREMGKLVLDPFLKNQHWPYFWISSLKYYKVCLYWRSKWRLQKYIKSKGPITFTLYKAS